MTETVDALTVARTAQYCDNLRRELYTLNTHWTGRQLDADERDVLSPSVRRRVEAIEAELKSAGQ